MRLDAAEGHFVYLNCCDSPLAANGVALCADRAGVERASVHARLAPRIAEFVFRALGAT